MDGRTRLIELIQAYSGGGGAPANATFLTLSTNATLTSERVLTDGHGIDTVDGGAGSTLTIAVDETELSHALLGDRVWASSGHTGTASRVAAFDGGGAASYLQVGVDLQAWDADLDTLAATSSTDGHVWRRTGGTWGYGTLSHTVLTSLAWTSSGHTGTDATLAGWSGGVAVEVATSTFAAASHTHAASDITSGVIATARLGSGSASSSTYLRGDQAWSTLSASDITTGAVSVAARLGWLTTASTANTTDATNGTTTNCPSWSVTSGKNYLIEVEGTFDCAASTNGFRCRLEESGGASSSVCAGQVLYSHASGVSAEPITAAGTWTTAGTGSTSRAGIRLCVHYHCTGTGTLTMGIRPETAGSAVNLYSSTLYRILEK